MRLTRRVRGRVSGQSASQRSRAGRTADRAAAWSADGPWEELRVTAVKGPGTHGQ